MEVDVAVADAGVHTERHGVDPDVAVGDLDALGPGGRAGGVVDARGGVLVRLPRLRLDVLGSEQVVVVAEDEAELGLDVGQRVVELGIDQQHPGPGVLDDVGHLVGPEPEVDRHQHPAGPGHPEERREQAGTVVADDRDPVADADAELVELRGLPSGQCADLGVGELPQGRGGLVGLIDDAGALAVDGDGAVDEVGDAERDDHACLLVTRSPL